MSETHDCKASISQILAWIERGDPISAADARRVITVAETAAKIGLEPEPTRLKEENERLRKRVDQLAAVASSNFEDATKIDETLRSTISDLLKVMEPFVRASDRIEHRLETFPLYSVSFSLTVGDLSAISEAFKKAKGTI